MSDIDSVVASLAEAYDQIVFLEKVAAHTARSLRPVDMIDLIKNMQDFIGATGAALNLNDIWLMPVPEWLLKSTKPTRSGFQLSDNHPGTPDSLLVAPFEGGWCAFWEKPGGFSASDERLATFVGEIIAPTLEAIEFRGVKAKAALLQHEQALAVGIWQAVMSHVIDDVTHYQLEAVSKPAKQVGGDFHAVHGDWVVVGDVSGKGIPAAVFSVTFVPLLHLALQMQDPGRALEDALFKKLESSGMFATLVAVHLGASGCLQYFNMGHNPVLVCRANGRVESLAATAPPLGTFELGAYPLRSVQLEPGDLFCLYSDGLTEAQKGADDDVRFLGEAALYQVLSKAQSATEVITRTEQLLEGWEITDDLTIIAGQYLPEVL